MKRRILLLTGSLLLSGVFLVSLVGAQQPKGTPIKIGLCASLSGMGYKGGQDTKSALEMAVEEINTSGGVLGRPVEMVFRDNKTDASISNRTSKELLVREKVRMLVGVGTSADILAASLNCKENHIPLLPNSGNSEATYVQKGHDYIFNFSPTSGMEGRAIATYANAQGWKKFISLAPDYEWGQSQVNFFKSKMAELGVPIKIDSLWFKLGETDFSRYITQLNAAEADCILIYAFGADIMALSKQGKQYGLFSRKIPIMGWWMMDALESLGKEAPMGVIGFERAPAPYLMEKFPMAKKFTNDFRKKIGTFPCGYALITYDLMQAWVKAVVKAKTDDPEQVSKALKGLTFDCTRGTVTLRPIDGQANVPVYFGKVFYDDNLRVPSYKDTHEIKAQDVWLTEQKVQEIRAQSK
jgi:branched-chain amino acid transport system substrate-binding protein